MRKLLEEIRTGTRTINGTDWPVEDQLHRTGEREWTVTRELCNGVPRSSEAYKTESAAREAFDRRLTGPKPRESEPATVRVEVRVTAAERKAWTRAAGEATLSDWIRSLCNGAAGL